MTRFAAVLFLLASSACSMDLVSVEVETQEVCVQGMNVSFVADENGIASNSFANDSITMDLDERFEADVRVRSVVLYAGAGANDLGFVRSLGVDIAQPELPLEPVAILAYNHSGEPAPELDLEASADVNVADYLRGGAVEFNMEVVGAIAEQTYEVGMDVCFAAKAAFRQPL